MDLGIGGRTALVTGGSRGIGRAVALALAREGARVALCARKRSDLDAVVAEVQGRGGLATAIEADVSGPEGCRRAVEATLEAYGGLEVLVNNVGGSLRSGPFDKATAEQWRQVLDANLMSAVWCSQHALGWMRDHGGGAIVNVSSICGREYCTSAAYSAAKAAMIAMTKEMAVDLAKHRVRVNSVAPGSILFPGGSWEARSREKPELVAKMLRDELPWGRFGTPEEVAEVVAFLCSTRASWVTGACVPIDGGQGRAL